MKRFSILICASLFLISCGDADDDFELVNDVSDGAEDTVDEVEDFGDELVEGDDLVDDDLPPPPSGTETLFFIPDNCDNPPTGISSNDGFQCIASRTRNDSLVCLLPFQFTWSPLTPFTDDAGFTFGCNANGDFFDEVTIFLTNGQSISLTEAGCFNFVATADGPIGRQHWRAEDVQFSSVENQLSLMVMTRNGLDTCLRF